jgi:alkyldihydroxyacetonephosphate synthase
VPSSAGLLPLQPEIRRPAADPGTITSGGAPPPSGAEVSLDVWGYRDTAFSILPNGSVSLSGARYALSGHELPDLYPWMKRVLGVDFDAGDLHPSSYPPSIPAPVVNRAFLGAVESILPVNAMTGDPLIRLRHGHGHTLDEMYAIKYGQLGRVPDLVVFPSTVDEVTALVAAAREHDVCLVPFGGGTNVTEALRCPSDESRMIVVVDLARFDRVLWIDADNQMACVQAGVTGAQLRAHLAAHGFTMGHEPDSFEFSTMGGWIATHASGMKKNRYGNIEDLVLDVHAVTIDGPLSRNHALPRESAGVDPRQLLFGSEGTLGIITHAVVKIFPLPDVERYDAILFRSFDEGVAFLRDLTRESTPPASVRLVDNLQFQFGQMLKPRSTGLGALRRRLERLVVTRLKGFDPQRMVACTLVFEGTREQVAREMAVVKRLARRHGGLHAGAENGRKGYELTFGIAYFRDFAMRHYILAESFETSVSWSEAVALCANVKRRVLEEYERRGLPGTPFISCRVTQLYQTGVAVYFYFGFHHKGVDRATEVYAEIEHAARDEILRSGGAVSHHHGIGKIRRQYLPRVQSPAARTWAARVKRALDPTNVFGIANQ